MFKKYKHYLGCLITLVVSFISIMLSGLIVMGSIRLWEIIFEKIK